MTRKPAHKPAGTSDGGQFAKTSHGEGGVTLTAQEQERARPLSLADLEWLQQSHGTYDPGPGYYEKMPKVFEAALEKAAASPDGRRELALRAKAEQLSDITGVNVKDIRGFHDEISGAEYGTEGWENLVQTYSEHYFNSPRGTTVFIESQMREAGAPVTERAALAAERDRLQTRIDALDINTAAAGILARFPAATSISATTTGEEDGSLFVSVNTADGTTLWSGDPDDEDDPLELEDLDLVPDKYAAKTSALRHCTAEADQPWIRRYDLDKMTALTADQIAGEKK